MKKLLLFSILILFSMKCLKVYSIIPKATQTEEEKQKEYNVIATMYYATEGQCDENPLVTAGNYKINPDKATEHKYIALSRNMLKRWGGEFNYGDLVKIEEAGHKDGVYKVVDTMNKRFINRIDFLETVNVKPYKFENVKLIKITV